jgi:aspartate aminotransferase
MGVNVNGNLLSARIQNVSPSITLAITSKAKAMLKEGIDVVGFGAGEPDFDTPDHIKDAAKKALDQGITKYAPASGSIELKQAIVKKLKNENGVDYTTANVVVSCGAKHSLYNIMQVICDPGDEVIIPAPYWVSYPEMVKLAGGKPVIVNATEQNDFRLVPDQLKSAITDKTKALVINSPSNPTGSMYDANQLKELAQIAVDNGLTIISDEIYERLVYDGGEAVSIASFSDEIKQNTITVNGFSKSYSMTGWRLGYLAATEEIAASVGKLQSQSTSNPTSFAMVGGIAALEGGQDCVAQMLKAFDQRRHYIVDRLNNISGVSCLMPNGAFYVFPNISGTGLGSLEFSERLLKESNVAVVPGIGFGADANIRLSYATSMEQIEKGTDRIEEFVKKI